MKHFENEEKKKKEENSYSLIMNNLIKIHLFYMGQNVQSVFMVSVTQHCGAVWIKGLLF